jgi:hypothetical protein
MDANRFDTIAKLFAARRSRRRALAGAGASLAAAGLAAAGLRAGAAQDATPDASPAAGDAGQKVAYLFVQSFQTGGVAPKEGEAGRYVLTLAQGLGQTVYFSDRPDRIVGATPTPRFLEGIGFPPDNPPNAALVAEVTPGTTVIAVVELSDPTYDETNHTATYTIKALADWEDSVDLGFTADPTDLAEVAPSFGTTHLFIDDCPDLTWCIGPGGTRDNLGPIPNPPSNRVGQCYQANPFDPNFGCLPQNCGGGQSLDYWKGQCNSAYAGCQNQCNAA